MLGCWADSSTKATPTRRASKTHGVVSQRVVSQARGLQNKRCQPWCWGVSKTTTYFANRVPGTAADWTAGA